MVAPIIVAYCLNGCLQTDIYNYHDFFRIRLICIITIICIRYTIYDVYNHYFMSNICTILLCIFLSNK